MYVIISYDVNVKRVAKVHKILKKYLQWTQNSVFEGELTEGKFKKCMAEVVQKIDESSDSFYVYRVENPKNMKKIIYGQERDFETLFL